MSFMAVKQTLKSSLFDEATADQQVIKSLMNEIRRLKMPIVKTVDGKFYRVDPEQEVSQDDVNAEVARLQAELASLESVVAPAEPAAPAAPEAPAAPSEPAAPADPAQDQSAPAAPATPEAPAQPADPAPAAPADPNAANPDPNAVNLS